MQRSGFDIEIAVGPGQNAAVGRPSKAMDALRIELLRLRADDSEDSAEADDIAD